MPRRIVKQFDSKTLHPELQNRAGVDAASLYVEECEQNGLSIIRVTSLPEGWEVEVEDPIS